MKAMKKLAADVSENAILSRLIRAEDGDLAPVLAKYLLTLGFSEQDQDRMNDLTARNENGALSPDERTELTNYVRTSHLLALLQSKARKSLRRRRAS
jgi:hypothetical protein